MRVEQQIEHGENSTNSPVSPGSASKSQMLINQLREITGIQDAQLLHTALSASQGDISHAVGLLTAQSAGEDQGARELTAADAHQGAWDEGKAPPKDDLQTAIELSLQQSQEEQEEERELTRALEASAEDSAARVKRKRCEAQGESCSPADWLRQEGWPVGLRNIGNTCWFSAVIQSLFHLPVFRRLVLNYCLTERLLEKCKSHSDKRNVAFMQELRCLFSLLLGSSRRFIDPSAAVDLLREAFRSSEAQQDVSEFTHKLLDWLEDAFQLAANGKNPEDKQENPMVQLFYGTFVAERTLDGKTLSNIEQFGQYPLQVNGFNNLDECLEGAMLEGEIEALHSDQTITFGRERWFSKLPPVLTFELSRFEFNTQLGRPEKIHKKLEFPQIIYMDRYLHKNVQQTHDRRGEVRRLKEQLTVLQQKLECYKNYGSGPAKYPLADMLQYMLEFATTKPTSLSPAEDVRQASSSPTPQGPPGPPHLDPHPDDSTHPDPGSPGSSDSSSCQQRTPIYKPFTQCRPPMDMPPHPAPHSVSEEELRSIKACLIRWRSEVENNMNELKASIDRVSQALEGMYCDNSLCQVPYRLHAVLVHEGQASAGHYWAYIYDHAGQRWMKYNDVLVSEASWEELVRDSYGGMTNASAYCLMYIDDRRPSLISEDTDDETGQVLQGLDSLPPALRRYVREDNRCFQLELREWEEQCCQQPITREEGGVAAPSTSSRPTSPAPATGEPLGAEPEQSPVTEEEPVVEPVKEPEEAPTPPEAAPPSQTPSPGSDLPAAAPPSQTPSPGSDLPAAAPPGAPGKEAHSQPPPPEMSFTEDARPLSPPSPSSPAPQTDPQASEVEAGPPGPDSGGEAGESGEAVLGRRRQTSESAVSEVEIPNVGRILVRADADGYNEEMMLTPAMQGVIMAIAKARQAFDQDGPEAGLIKAFHEEYSRLLELSQTEASPQEDPRLQHILVYLFQNQAPNRVVERTLLEQFTDRNLSFDDRAISIMREARSKLRLIKPEDMDMDEYMQWHDDYSLFRTVCAYLLTGLEHYQHGKPREALSYLCHAHQSNAALLGRGERRGVDQTLIALYRRKCLKEVNDSAAVLFKAAEAEGVEEGVAIINEAVIPCMHLMSRDALEQDDLVTMETIRNQWCSYLGQDLDDSLQEKLGEFLPRVLDSSAETVVLKDPPTVRSSAPNDLCSRLAAVMESIHDGAVVSVK
ncbi:ubiquitin carboxyl-terminal hydrolase 28 isoform X2 [Osmerus eperlanus]|uniref:ubiquitin carboxyl-terminal hydrolase 28 isoform X2 n=1 Tax=Osmerus eperlanus TaxID=29151 RepID=UPI002E0D411A